VPATGKLPDWVSKLRRSALTELTQVGKELHAVVAAAMLIGIGVGVAFLVLQYHKVAGDAVVVALVFAPILVYAIVSGRVSELSGGGLLRAKFNATARQPVNAATTEEVPIVEVLEIGGNGAEEDHGWRRGAEGIRCSRAALASLLRAAVAGGPN
jgi:hypothetical protein